MYYSNFSNNNYGYGYGDYYKESENSGLNLVWENVNVIFNDAILPRCCGRGSDRYLLRNQYGQLSSGELVGLLGSSGSGKTTLLNALSFRRIQNLTTKGSIKVNGIEMNREDMLSISSYVQQEDLFIGTLTVREHLMFHAMLRMDRSLSRKEKEHRVHEIIQELMLAKCQDAFIGIPGKIKGISGGEKKRLSLATEILNNPMLLFCDEPTSGLDSAMAISVIQSLKKIAGTGKTVLLTIHQPSSDIFLMFDFIYILYDGLLAVAGTRDEIINFLSSMNMRMPSNYNPADFMIDKLSLKPQTLQYDTMRCEQIVQRYQTSQLYYSLLNKISSHSQPHVNRQIFLKQYIKYKNNSHPSVISEIFYIFKRNAVNFFRDKGLLFMRVFEMILFAVLVGITYLRLDLSQIQSDVINRAIFMAIMCVSLVTSLSSIVLYPHEFPILCKENESRVYSVFSYFISNILFEIPIYVFLTLLFVAINYWLVGLNSRAECFFVAFGWLILVSMNGLAYGHMLSALTSNPLAAVVVLIPALMFQFVMNEFFLTYAGSPLDWLKYVCWVFYSFNLMMLNQWKSIDSLSGSDASPKNGDDILNIYGIKSSLVYAYVIGFVGLIFLWRIIAFIVTLIRVKLF